MRSLIVLGMIVVIASGASGQDSRRPVITAQNAAQVKLLASTGSDRIYDLDWSIDGTHIAVFSRNHMSVYGSDLAELQVLMNDPCGVSQYPCRGTVEFTEDGRTLLVGSGGKIQSFDAESSFTPLATYQTEIDTSVLRYSQGQHLLMYGGGPPQAMVLAIEDFDVSVQHNEPQFVDFWRGQGLRGLLVNDGPASSIALSPDGRFLAISNTPLFGVERQWRYDFTRNVTLIELAPLFERRDTLPSPPAYYEISPDDETDRIILSGKEDEAIRRLAFSPDGTLLAGAGLDGHIRVWSIPDGGAVVTLEGQQAAVWDVVFSPNGQMLASASWDGTIRFWDASQGFEPLQVVNFGIAISAIAFNPDGTQLAVGAWDGSLWIFDTARGEVIHAKPGRWWTTWTVAFNAEGTRFALGNDNNEVILYDVLDDAPFIIERQIFDAPHGPIYSVVFHPDGQHLAAGGSEGLIYVWDLDSGVLTDTLETSQRAAVYGLAYGPDDSQLNCATTDGYGSVQSYGDTTWCSLVFERGDPVYSLAYSPDGTLLAYGDTQIKQVEGYGAVTLDTQRGWSDSYRSSRSKLSFSADGSTLLNGGTSQPAYIWRMDDLARPTLIGWGGLLALSPDGSLVAGGTMGIFDAQTGEELLMLEPPPTSGRNNMYRDASARDAVFSPDGSLIVTAGIDGVLRFWGIPND